MEVATDYFKQFVIESLKDIPDEFLINQLPKIQDGFNEAIEVFDRWLRYEFREWSSSTNDIAISYANISIKNTISDLNDGKYKKK